MKKTREEVITYINALQGYQGYVQFSHRPIDKTKDIFYDGKKVEVHNEDGFIYEAHFCNDIKSISIRQLNDSWMIATTDIQNIKFSKDDTQTYLTDIKDFNYKVKMAQIWEAKKDNLCADMEVMKLQKVVFLGFEKVESK